MHLELVICGMWCCDGYGEGLQEVRVGVGVVKRVMYTDDNSNLSYNDEK